ncbi:MAG: 4'-phosphopantetheinyl transferase superfamily protein [Chitinophagales bacterium]|jgi:phosphopantetheinyl transferase|nr:4'-phosphopantetheinyl transferase superfamily protein [Chitinophagales bacterium]
MSLLIERTIANGTLLAVWDISEDADWFYSKLILNKEELRLIAGISHPQRKLHYLASRVLLRTVMKTDEFIHLENDLNGKPVILNFPMQVSLSHSASLTALLLSDRFEVGIDIEKIDPKICRIQHKFMKEEELNGLSEENELETLYVYWCAKEAMYKLYGKKQLNFLNHLFIKPFKYMESGNLQGVISKEPVSCDLNVHYEKIDDYMLAYVMNENVSLKVTEGYGSK